MFSCMLDRLESGIVLSFSYLSTEKAIEVSVKMCLLCSRGLNVLTSTPHDSPALPGVGVGGGGPLPAGCSS